MKISMFNMGNREKKQQTNRLKKHKYREHTDNTKDSLIFPTEAKKEEEDKEKKLEKQQL